MTAAACSVYFHGKLEQAEKVFAERYAATVGPAPQPALAWAAQAQPELARAYREAQAKADALWLKGECSEVFKGAVMAMFRALIEIGRLYAAELGGREAA
jgi:hypothetical protein